MHDATHCLLYQPAQAPREIPLEEVSDYVDDTQNFILIDMQTPSSELLSKLGNELNFHELTLEDALTTHQRPKLEEYGEDLFISCRTAALTAERMHLDEMHLFIGANFIVVIRHQHGPDLARTRERLKRLNNGFKPGRAAALYFILDEIIDHYQPVIALMQNRFRDLEDLLLHGGLVRQELEELYTIKRELTTLREAIDPMQGVVLDLIRLHPTLATKELKVYFRDVYDHTIRAVSALDLLRASAFDAMQFHMATLTLRQNEAVQKLAGWGAILAIPTVIFSLYGMNFKVMPELDWIWAYPTVVLCTFGGAFWLYRRLKKRGWI